MNSIDRITTQHAEDITKETHQHLPMMVKEIMRAFKRSQRVISDQVENILDIYGLKGGFDTRLEAIQFLNQTASSDARNLLLQQILQIKDESMRKKLLAWYDAKATRGRLTNRRIINDIIYTEARKLGAQVDSTMTKHLNMVIMTTVTRSAYTMQRATHVGFSFEQPNKVQLAGILKRNYSPAYSEIFANGYGDAVKEHILGGLMAGDDVHNISARVAQATDMELWKAKRFVRTEITMSSNAAEAYHLEKAGYERYRYYATLDERTCPRCGKHDGKVYNMSERQQGENFPPLHENCRCHIVAVVSDAVIREQKRKYRDPTTGKNNFVPASMTYEEWAEKYLV